MMQQIQQPCARCNQTGYSTPSHDLCTSCSGKVCSAAPHIPPVRTHASELSAIAHGSPKQLTQFPLHASVGDNDAIRMLTQTHSHRRGLSS